MIYLMPVKNYLRSGFAHLAIIIIIAITAVGAIGFYAFKNGQLKINPPEKQEASTTPALSTTVSEPPETPTSNPTANWETYTNSENGYLVKFPKTEFTRLGCMGEELTAAKKGSDNRPSPMVMIACERDGRYTLETKTYNSIQPLPNETKYYNIEEKNLMLAGLPAVQFTYTFTNIEEGPFPKWYTIVWINKNGKTYEIYFGDKSNLELFDQILSTFKFLN
jgi:hypothetical protein